MEILHPAPRLKMLLLLKIYNNNFRISTTAFLAQFHTTVCNNIVQLF